MSASVVAANEIRGEHDGGGRVVCKLPDGLVAQIEPDVVERLEREALEAFRAVTRRGSEIGGLLLGSMAGGVASIHDFELVDCEFARGPLYVLSENDHLALKTAIGRHAGAVVGLFRSNTRKELAPDEEDAGVAARHLRAGSLVLLVKPFVTKPSQAAVCRWVNGAMGAPVVMPFRRMDGAAPVAPAHTAQSQPPVQEPPPAAKEPPALRIVSRREEIPAEVPPSPPAAQAPAPEPPPPEPQRRTPPAVALPQPSPDPAVPDAEMAAALFTRHPFWSRPWVLGAALLVMLAAGAMYVFSGGDAEAPPPASSHVSSSLALRVERSAGQLVLTWNREAPAVRNARRAVLSVWDGKQAEKIELEANQFRGGSIVYAPVTSDVSFRLEIFGPTDSERFSEHVRVLGGKPSPMAPPAVEPAKAAPDGAADQPPEQADADPAEEEEVPARPVKATKQFQSLAARIKTPAAVLPEPPAITGRSVELPKAIGNPALAPPPPAPAAVSSPATAERVGGMVQDAKVLRRREPSYPPLAKQARVSGAVRLSARITRDGRVTDLKALSGHPLLRQAAIDAVSQWVYSPATLNGEPVDATTTVEITFNLNGR